MEPRIDPNLEARALAWREGRGPAPGLDEVDEELRCLLLAMGIGAAVPRPATPDFIEGQPIHAGYRLVAETNDRSQVVPAFARALAAGLAPERRWLFEHLWGVDLALWKMRENGDFAHVAERWLRSPGRRLVRELTILRAMREPPPDERDGATDLRLAALWAASGADEAMCGPDDTSPGAVRWRDLHDSIPGRRMTHWSPKLAERGVVVAFSRLERGSPFCLRGAAIGWLLGETVDRPLVEVGGIRQDLREVLPGRLAVALQLHEDPAEENFVARLEEATLLHAAFIAARDPSAGRVRRAWHLARWIHGCLARSPFVGEDAERLRARLLALLPAEPPAVDLDDPMHPARFGPNGLRIEDVALVAGIWAHYGRDGAHLTPTPLPLVQAIRRLAGRPLRSGEREAEESLARGTANELEWTAPHVAPPWVARRLLTEWRIPWLPEASSEVIRECLDSLWAPEPDGGPPVASRFEWFAHVWRIDGPAVSEPLQAHAHGVWRRLRERGQIADHALASLAIGLLARLDEHDRVAAFAAIQASGAAWQPFLLDAWAEEALRLQRPELAEPAFAALLERSQSTSNATDVRLNAALLLLRRAATVRDRAQGANYLHRLAELAEDPPFREQTGLLRELRRLGAATVRRASKP
jgi:hypothetical protein